MINFLRRNHQIEYRKIDSSGEVLLLGKSDFIQKDNFINIYADFESCILREINFSNHKFHQSLFWDGKNIDHLLKLLSFCFRYGSNDENESLDNLDKNLKDRILFLGCSNLSHSYISILNRCGVRCRLTSVHTIQKRNFYEDGHTLIEINLNNNWVAYDTSFNCFYNLNGNRASIVDVCKNIDLIEVERLSKNYPGCFWNKEKRLDILISEKFESQYFFYSWFKRVFNIPLIQHNSKFYFPTNFSSFLKHQKGYYIPIEENEFAELFYHSKV